MYAFIHLDIYEYMFFCPKTNIIFNTTDATYKTHEYKVQLLFTLNITWNCSDVSNYTIKKSVIRLKFQTVENILLSWI